MNTHVTASSFSNLGLPKQILKAVEDLGYQQPSAIQAQAIPSFLQGKDILGQAQTGTGKTAAFALPILANIDIKSKATQVLVLTPTRELALQISAAFVKYGRNLPGISILPIYGGQGYAQQISALKAGVQIVVGTPGRVIDHLERKRLDISQLKTLVLDEADEMLRMGFIEDVEWILAQSPEQRQVALFSATMPLAIKSIADRYLKNPVKITVESKTKTASTIEQYYWPVNSLNKLDALSRILEGEAVDGIIVFVNTKQATEEVSMQLKQRGFLSAALNGDIQQDQREKTVSQLKDGKINIIVATDVAARGLDVKRISHVINYEPPRDIESYIHRIGRTGRAGKSGIAILFLTKQEHFFLQRLERVTKQPLKAMEMPSLQQINQQRINKFKQKLTAELELAKEKEIDFKAYIDLIEQYQTEFKVSAVTIAAILAKDTVKFHQPKAYKLNAEENKVTTVIKRIKYKENKFNSSSSFKNKKPKFSKDKFREKFKKTHNG